MKMEDDNNVGFESGRVKKLLEQFEKSVTITTLKSTSLSATRNRYQRNSRQRGTKQASAGIYQKRSILRRKSKSHTDVRPNVRSSVLTGRYNVMSKSCSQGECSSGQVDLLTAIRNDFSKKSSMQQSNVGISAASATSAPSSSLGPDCGLSEKSMFVQSMYAGSSAVYTVEQKSVRKYRPKPPPPIKPARLKSSCRKDARNSFLPVVPPKPQVFPSVCATDLPQPVNSSERTNTKKETISSEGIKAEATTSTGDLTTETRSCVEEAKGETSSLESKRILKSTVSTSRRTSFINEEIKKPKTKPPPPPTHSPPSSSSLHLENENIEANIDILKKSSDNDDSKSSKEVSVDELKSLPKAPRFERRCVDGQQIPCVPSIPPPLPPVLSLQESNNDEMYEEIEQLIYDEETDGSEFNRENPSSIEVFAMGANFDESNGDGCYGKQNQLNDDEGDEMKDNCNKVHSNNNQFVEKSRGPDDGKRYIKRRGFSQNLAISNRNRKAAAAKRPKSALEFDRLLRIKSDIQLNITRKVGQIKLKVSSASQEKKQNRRLSSIFYVDQETLKNRSNDDDVLAKIEFPLDEQCIYGDDWSSDDDDDATSTEQQSSFQQEQTENRMSERLSTEDIMPKEHYSMLSEIERELRLRFETNSNLPDVVLESKRRSVSADPLPQDSTSNMQEVTSESYIKTNDEEDMDNDGRSNTYGPHKDVKLRPTLEGYETVMSPTSSPERNCLPSTSSEYTLKEIDRSVYTPRIIPDPQPLYQIYMMEQNGRMIYEEHEAAEPHLNRSVDKISKVQRVPSTASTDSGRGADCSTTMSQLTSHTSMRRDRLVAGSHFGSQRSLWCELPEVKNAGLLETLDEEMKKLQEAYFEVITSEASYLRSVNILITHFMAAPEMLGSKGPSSVISNEERKQLFSNIFAVRDCSERLLSDLENRLQSNLLLSDVCDILCDHFESNFDSYVKYCSNQVYQDRTLRKLKSGNPSFLSCIQRLEGDRLCQGLDMRSFLMLPMQRVTRYPLLVIAILERTQQDTTNYQTAQIALHLANHIVTCCNEGARRMERTEQLLEIERRLVYKSSDLKRIPLVSSGRYLVKRGSLTCLNEKRSKKFLQTRQQFQTIYVFLFSDIIMITKKKINGTYICKDYSARRFVDIEPIEIDDPKLLQSVVAHIPLKKPHLFICTLMHNARGKQVELLLNADSETDRERWLSALRPPACSNPEEKIYADWDCPQAVVVHQYSPGQEDELPLEKGDLINILRKMPDGWFYGERIRDGFSGWFPSSYVQQILNDHVRAKNYRQRLRVIQAAANFRYREEHLKVGTEGNVRHAPHLMDRFRRLSNTKNILHD